MLTKSQCTALAEAHLAQLAAECGEPLILLPDVVEREAVFAYFYQSAAFLASGDPSDALAGNGPILVNRASGEVVTAGTALPLEHYIRQLEVEIAAVASNNSLNPDGPVGPPS